MKILAYDDMHINIVFNNHIQNRVFLLLCIPIFILKYILSVSD